MPWWLFQVSATQPMALLEKEASLRGPRAADLYVCVHCGSPAGDLYQQVGQEIRLLQCKACGQNVDHYIEFEILLVLIDLQLFREAVYRHILQNRFAGEPQKLRREAWRFLLLCFALDARVRWLLRQGPGSAPVPSSALPGALPEAAPEAAAPTAAIPGLALWSHWLQRGDPWPMLAWSALEAAAYLLVVSSVASLYLVTSRHRYGARWPLAFQGEVLVALSVSSFGKLYALVAMIWGGDGRQHVQLAVAAFVAASNAVGVKAALGEARWGPAIAAVASGVAARSLLAAAAPVPVA